MKGIHTIFLLLLFALSQNGRIDAQAETKEQWGQVILPIVDVYSDRNKIDSKKNLSHDFNQTTQLLWGEEVIIAAENKDWINVKIPNQSIFCRTSKRQKNCAGWIKRNSIKPCQKKTTVAAYVKVPIAHLYTEPNNSLSPEEILYLGSPVSGYQVDETWWKIERPHKKNVWIKCSDLRKNDLRKNKKYNSPKKQKKLRSSLIKTGMFFLNNPYQWGGRSIYQPDKNSCVQHSSVDCSSLSQLIYQSHGIIIPRNSTGQYFASKRLRGDQLLPGDLIFLSSSNNAADISHVMIYLGNNELLEASSETKKVRIISSYQKLKTSITSIKSGKKHGKYYVFLGTFL